MSAYLGVIIIASAIAIGSICVSWSCYWQTASTLRQQIAACPESTAMRFTIVNVEVEQASAAIHRPAFIREKRGPQPQALLRAA